MPHRIERKIEEVHDKIFSLIQNKDSDAPLITYEAMSKIGFFKTDKLEADGVESERIRLDLKNSLVFMVKMKKGALINTVRHDCVKRIFVRHGELENLNVRHVIREMQEDTIYPLSKNTLKAREDTMFFLRFIKPDING